jgi:hypothetical protein
MRIVALSDQHGYLPDVGIDRITAHLCEHARQPTESHRVSHGQLYRCVSLVSRSS